MTKTIRKNKRLWIMWICLFAVVSLSTFVMSSCSFLDGLSPFYKNLHTFIQDNKTKVLPSIKIQIDDNSNFNSNGDLLLDYTTDDLYKLGFSNFCYVSLAIDDSCVEVPIVDDDNIVATGQTAIVCEYNPYSVHQQMNVRIIVKNNSFRNIYIKRDNSELLQLDIRLIYGKYYYDSFINSYLQFTNHRHDYQNLNDTEYSLFKSLNSPGLKQNYIYSSLSPIDNSLGRAKYVDKILMEKGITNVINLVNTEEEALNLPDFYQTYYSKCNILYAPLNNDMHSESFKAQIFKIVSYVNENEGPILIHGGNDLYNVSFVCSLLEMLSGSTYDYVVSDFVKQYGYLYNKDIFNKILVNYVNENGNKVEEVRYPDMHSLDTFQHIFNVMMADFCKSDLSDAYCLNLTKSSYQYLRTCNLDDSIIYSVKYKLTKNRY